jgi:hypothetical protein
MLALSVMVGCAGAPGASDSDGRNVNAQSSNTAPVILGVTTTPERLRPGIGVS